MSTPSLLTTRQAAELLGVTTRQVARLVESEKLAPAARGEGVRGPMFFSPDDVKALSKPGESK